MRLLLLLLVISTSIACKDEHGHGPGQHTHETPPPLAPPTTTHHAAHNDAPDGYTCPMHPEVKSATPARCPKCKMDLVPARPAAANKTFTVDVTTTPAPPAAGKPTSLTFAIKDEKKEQQKEFDVVHEKKLHLLMVSDDLAWFAHEHPELKADGSFVLDNFTFPRGGKHVLYVDAKPTGANGVVLKAPIVVDGAAPAAAPLKKSDLQKALTVGAYQVRLNASSTKVGDASRLEFLIVKDGKPVTDLTPYLGALGHCVIITPDHKQFLHSHPEDAAHGDSAHDHTTGTAEHAHPKLPGQVVFNTSFPEPGLYKIWGQFQHGSEMIIAPFVVEATK